MDIQVMQQSEEVFEPRYRIDEEYEYYTELATNASQLWIESILRKRLPYQDDFRKSLEDGIIFCELLNTLRPGCIKKINRLPSKIAGIDNLTIFLQTCSDVFSLHEKQLFQVSDLDDLTERAIPANQLADEQGKRIRRVLTTVFYLAKAATGLYDGSPIDFTAFTGIVTPCPPSGSVSSGNGLPIYNREPSATNGNNEVDKQSRVEDDSPFSSAKTASTPSVAQQNTRASDQSPTRLSDTGSFDSSSNLSSNQGLQQKEQNSAPPGNRTSQNRTSQAHHFVKSGFSLPTGPSNLTKTAVEQMRLISESRSSTVCPAPAARSASLQVTSSVNEADAWQSDLDMWRMRRKQSMQATLPAEVLQSVGLLEDGSDESKLSENSDAKKSNKKPGLLSKLRYSLDQEEEDPVAATEKKEMKDSFSSLASTLKEKLPPISDAPDSPQAPVEKSNGHKSKVEEEKEEPEKISDVRSSISTTNETPLSEKVGYKDLIFTINQAPNNLRGFGFSVKGGRDAQMPLVIERVTAGSAADEADVHVDDEILKINNESVQQHFRPTLNRLIQQCVKAGQINLAIRRYNRPVQEPQPPVLSSSKSMPPLKPAASVPLAKAESTQRVSPRVGPGPLVMEQEIKVRSPEPLLMDDPEIRQRNQPRQPSITKLPQPTTSPALSSSSSSNSSSNQQRVILGVPRGYRGSPSAPAPQTGSPLTSSSSSSKDETITSGAEMPPRNGSIGSSSGAILVRGATNSNQPPPTTTINDQSPSIAPPQNGRSPYYSNPSQIPQPWNQNTAPPPQQQPEPFRNGSAKKENSVTREPAPETPPQLPRSVSSRELCAACQQPLGAGPAMAIERLGLFYHVRCFRCSVCKISLSNGQTGVDVRVKGSRLHCQNCNSSDESGLQSSQV